MPNGPNGGLPLHYSQDCFEFDNSSRFQASRSDTAQKEHDVMASTFSDFLADIPQRLIETGGWDATKIVEEKSCEAALYDIGKKHQKVMGSVDYGDGGDSFNQSGFDTGVHNAKQDMFQRSQFTTSERQGRALYATRTSNAFLSSAPPDHMIRQNSWTPWPAPPPNAFLDDDWTPRTRHRR